MFLAFWLLRPTYQQDAIWSNIWSTWSSTWLPKSTKNPFKRLPKSIAEGIDNMMQVGSGFGTLSERFLVDFGAKLGAKIGERMIRRHVFTYHFFFEARFYIEFRWFQVPKFMYFWSGRHASSVVNSVQNWVLQFFRQGRFWCLPGFSQAHFLRSFWYQVGTKLAPKLDFRGSGNRSKQTWKNITIKQN